MNNKKFTKLIKQLIIFLLPIFIVISCKNKEQKNVEEIVVAEVTSGFPVQQKMTQYLDLSANTLFQKQENIRATFQGFIEKTFKSIGDKVRQGDDIYWIRTKESSSMDSTDLVEANKNFNGLIKIKAKTTGVLTELHYQTGDYVADGDPLALVVDPNSLKIVLNVPFQFAKYVNPSGVYSFYMSDGKVNQARIIKEIPSIDAINQTQSFILQPPEKSDIPSNLNIIVKIPVNTAKEAIALPKSAVMTDETQKIFWVMKIINDTTAVRLNIVKGIESDNMIQILEPGIGVNDRFIIEGAFGLPDTAKIKIKK